MKSVGRHIVNIVSMAGLVATAKSSLYSATKFAAIGFSNALRLELMPFGVHVTTVNPGPIRPPSLTRQILTEVMSRLWTAIFWNQILYKKIVKTLEKQNANLIFLGF